MKKALTFMLLLLTMVSITPLLNSCGGDEPDEPATPNTPIEDDSKFDDLYGYWINTDYSGAMNIVASSSYNCKVLYYVYDEGFPGNFVNWESNYYGDTFTALAPVYNGYEAITVKINSITQRKLILENAQSGKVLTSYIFNRVDEDTFYNYLENGNGSGSGNTTNDDAKKLYGTWVGKDYDDTYTLTFYASGKVTETWSDGYDSETTTGTYAYSNGRITKWDFKDGSFLANTIEIPGPVTFNSSTSMTIGSGLNKMTFTKK